MFSGKLARGALSIRALVPQLAVIEGSSMEPTLRAGDWVLVGRNRPAGPRLGQVVVVEHPHRPRLELIKRVSALSRQRRLVWVGGDNRGATSDSEDFGPLPLEALRGVVLARIRPRPWKWLRADPSRI